MNRRCRSASLTEPDDKRRLLGGTFGLPCHDPGAVEFRTIRVHILSETEAKAAAGDSTKSQPPSPIQ